MIVVASPSSARVHKGLRAQKQKSIYRVSNSVPPPAKSAWPFPLHHDTLHVHPSLKMQLYNPLTIVPSSGPLSLWPSHSFWDPNLIKKCPPVPTIIAWTRTVRRSKYPAGASLSPPPRRARPFEEAVQGKKDTAGGLVTRTRETKVRVLTVWEPRGCPNPGVNRGSRRVRRACVAG